jgi:MGT family glycosyltransferase
MAKILAFSFQSPGHLYPFVSLLHELQSRGHAVVFGMFQTERRSSIGGIRIRRVTARLTGLDTTAMQDAAGLELVPQCGEPLARAMEHLIHEEQPDFILVDPMLWGGMVAAEASGLPWASLSLNPKTIRGTRLDARGSGMAPARTLAGRFHHGLVSHHLRKKADRALPLMNAVRSARNLEPLQHVWSCYHRAPLTIAATAVPFEYPRTDWPSSLRFVGPMTWEPEISVSLDVDRVILHWSVKGPLVLLVGSSIEEQGKAGSWVETAIQALGDGPYRVIATLPTDWMPKRLPRNIRAYQFLPHTKLLPHAACVVCHGGSGITHKALASGVPVVAVPFGYDRFEVARRVEVARAGAMVAGPLLTAARLRSAVEKAVSRRSGAERIAKSFSASGGAAGAASHVEDLLNSWISHRVASTRTRPVVS